MKRLIFSIVSIFLFSLPAFATAPVCLFTDVTSGPATGGEGGNGIYLTIFGKNFGSSQGSSTVTVNGKAVAQYLMWSHNYNSTALDAIGVQISSATTGTGSVVVTTSDGSCSNLSFKVRTGKIYFIGPTADTSSPGSCATLLASNSYTSPWGLTNNSSGSEGSYSYSSMRTPYTYFNCISAGDTLVFLNGVNYPGYDGRGWHAALTNDKSGANASNPVSIMARPGATVTLGGAGTSTQFGIRGTGTASYSTYSGMTLIGAGGNGSGVAAANYDITTGNKVECPTCSGEAGGGVDGSDGGATGQIVRGNWFTLISTTNAPSNKQFHCNYMGGNNFEVGWNRFSNNSCYNGIQVNEDGNAGFYNFSIHDNDISEVNGSGINLATVAPNTSAGEYVEIYNNVIHHVGIERASDGGEDDPHNCLAVKGSGSSSAVGTIEVYNNTMYDCSSIVNNISSGESEAGVFQIANSQTNVTTNLVNNIAYQPAYTYSGNYNIYFADDNSPGSFKGSNNIFYSGGNPGSTTGVSKVGTIANPEFVDAADGAFTNFELQSGSPAINAGVPVGAVHADATTYGSLSWDFNGVARSGQPTLGAFEYGTGASTTGPSPAQVTASATPDPASVEEAVTLSATVAKTASATPTGSVTFMNGSSSLGAASLDSTGTASMTISTLAVGSYSVVGSYSGDSNYGAAQSSAASLQVMAAATSTSLSATPDPANVGQSVTLTAVVGDSGGPTPSGTVTFMNGSTQLGTGAVSSSGVATLSTSSLAAGTYSMTAKYSGSSTLGASTSAAASVTVTASAQSTTTSLAASSGSITAGQSLTLTATVKGSGSTTPTGTVNFMSGSTQLGSATVSSSGAATLSTSTLAAGTYSLTAQYAGNAASLASSSTSVSVTVNAATQSTTTALVASANSINTGQTLTLTATVKGSGSTTPTGTVNFLNGSTQLGAATLSSSGVATLSTSTLAVGTYTLTAQYAGNTSSLTSTSAAVSVTVTTAAQSTSTSLAASGTAITTGQPLTLTATVKGSGTTIPSGTVNFMNGTAQLGSSSVNASGVASISTSTLAAGTYTLTAQYAGNTASLGSSSNTITVTITAAAQSTTTSLAASGTSIATGQTLTLTATVKGSGTTTPTGSVNFMNGSTLLGTGTVNGSGVASVSTSSLAAGTYTLTAQYAGNSASLSSTSGAVSVTVTAAAQSTTTSLSASSSSITAGQSLTLTATVKGSGTTTPTGSVNFINGSTLLGTGTVNGSGVASVSTSSLAAGTYTLTAQYAGNTASLSSTSGAVSVTVTPVAQATTTTLGSSATSITVGQALTLTATVKGSSSVVSTGTVVFQNGSTQLGAVTVSSTGVATLTTSSLAAGTYTLTAQYTGTTSFSSSSSAAVSISVTAGSQGNPKPQASTTSLTTSSNTIASGQVLSLTATVKGSGSVVPTGTVTFMDGSTALGTGTLNASGVATFSDASLAMGSHTLTASYGGSASFLSSNSAGVAVQVSATAVETSTHLAASPDTVLVGQPLILTASVKGTASRAPLTAGEGGGFKPLGTIPTSTVTFWNGTTMLGTAALNASGVATLSVSTLPIGTYRLTAHYSGSSIFVASTSAPITVIVRRPSVAKINEAPAVSGGTSTKAPAATKKSTAIVPPTASVTLLNGTKILGSARAYTSKETTLEETPLAAGGFSVTTQ